MIKKLLTSDVPRITRRINYQELADASIIKEAQQFEISNVSYGNRWNRYDKTFPAPHIEGICTYTTSRGNTKQCTITVDGLPTKYSDKENEAYCFCPICYKTNRYTPHPLCKHAVALIMAYDKEYGPIELHESDTGYSQRQQDVIFDHYTNEVNAERQKFSPDLIPASSQFPNIQVPKIVLYDLPQYLEKCVTCEAAVYRAKQIKADPDTTLSFNDYIETQSDSNTKILTITMECKAYPTDIHLQFTIHGRTVMWNFASTDRLIPYDSSKQVLNRQEFLNEYQLLLLENAIDVIAKDTSFADVTDNNAMMFFSNVEKTWNRNQDNEEDYTTAITKNTYHISARICNDFSNIYLVFIVSICDSNNSNKKTFVIRNLVNFVNAYRNNDIYDLSKAYSLDFSEANFTEDSLKILTFLSNRIYEVTDAYRIVSSYISPKIAYQQPLSGITLDNFYTATEGLSIEYVDKRNSENDNTIKVCDCKLNFTVTVKPTKDTRSNLTGISVTGQIPTLHYGANYKYLLTSTNLSRISPQDIQNITPFLAIANKQGEFTFFIGLPNLNEFYYRILPSLSNNPVVTLVDKTQGLVAEYLLPEPEFTFYLDINDENDVTLRATVSYNENTYHLADVSDPNVYRDKRQEDRVITEIQKSFTKVADNDDTWFRNMDADELFTFINSSINRLAHFGTVKGSDAFNRLKVTKLPTITIGVSIDSDLLDISITSNELDKKELLAILKSYTLKKKWHKLSTGEFIDLNNDPMLEEIMDLLEKIDLMPSDVIQKRAKLPLFRALYLDKLMQEHEELASVRDQTYRKLIRSFNDIKDSDFEPPETLQNTLREYQKYGYKWLETIKYSGFGGILADDMGLGKTLQTISVLLEGKNADPQKKPDLVVCPASLVYNWAEEIKRFAPNLIAVPLTGNLANRKEALANIANTDIYIISYELLNRDIAFFKDLQFNTMVIDEAQHIKNPKAGHTKAVKTITAKTRFALTGTPIENRLSELWSIFDYIMPGFLYNYTEFNRSFETAIVKNGDEAAVQKLKNMTSPFILRRKKDDVLKNLPAKIDEVHYSQLTGEQQKLYDAQVIKMQQLINSSSNTGEDKIKILAELTKIRQICCDPSLLFENYHKESAKRQACMELVESAIDGGHRILLFSQFTSMLELLEKDLKERNIEYYKITGSTTKEKRIALVHSFNEGTTPVFLISLKAGGTGLNLTGADTVIHYDPWWNQAVQNQATDRAHRIGQTKTVTVYRLILKNTIEEKILKLQETKKDLADSILEGSNQSLMSLSSEELLALLS